MNREQIDKIAQTPEDKILLAKIWDKIQSGMTKNIPSWCNFLSPRELDMTRYLFGSQDGLFHFGGFDDAERKMLIYLPEYLSEDWFSEDSSPIACLRATFYEADSPTHRDFLGALIGIGITRDSIGDICVSKGSCDFFITAQIAPYLLQNFTSAGRTKLKLEQIPLLSAKIPQPEIQEIRDTLASLRLDSIVSSGFRISRNAASQAIESGKVCVNGLPVDKPDKAIAEDSTVSLRGGGKIKLAKINGETKKGRISVVMHRYL